MGKRNVDLPHPYNKVGDGPEGPEARTVADQLRGKLSGKTILTALKTERAKVSGWETFEFPAEVVTVRSHGKKIIIELFNAVLVVSLGMTGKLLFSKGEHSHVYFQFGELKQVGSLSVHYPEFELFFDDTRFFGRIDVVLRDKVKEFFAELGPDLLEAAQTETTWIGTQEWLKIYRKKRPSTRAVHDLLCDQSYVSGMGWYLITEILYYAGVHPERANNTLSEEDWERIRVAAHKVILLSYHYGGFTIESFISPDGSKGVYPAVIYGKTHDPLGRTIVNKALKNGRTAHFVPEVQK